MPAKSQAQQRLMAIALHKPDAVHEGNKSVLGMSLKKLREYASTKRKKLPQRSGGSKNYIRSAMMED